MGPVGQHPAMELDDTFDFLDVEVLLGPENQIETNLFEKDSNAYMYLHTKSNHPKQTKQKIAYGLALRARRICSKDEDYSKSKKNISKRLMLRGHNE